MNELERDLTALESRLDFPDADIRPGVWAGIAAKRTRRRRRVSLALAFAILAIAFTPAIALHGARNGILRALGIHDTGPAVVAQSAPVVITLHDGSPTTLAAAAAKLSFTPILPGSLPKPEGVYVGTSLDGGTLTLLFSVGGRELRLREFRGASVETSPGVPVSIRGQPGVWLKDTDTFTYRDSAGKKHKVQLETPGNALVWQHGSLTLQLQSVAMTQTYAVALARTVV